MMHLKPNELLFGVAPEILMDCARQLHARDGRPFSLADFCEVLGAPVDEASAVLAQMAATGFFRTEERSGDCYGPTAKLGQLALANISHGLPRAEAVKLLQRVIDKAKLINSESEKYECRVTCLVVFGSYLTDKEVLGDLDIGVEIHEVCRAEKASRGDIRKCLMGGSTPQSRAIAALRLQKPKQISAHLLEEVLRLETPYRVVFGAIEAES